jgi:hypothetical protein
MRSASRIKNGMIALHVQDVVHALAVTKGGWIHNDYIKTSIANRRQILHYIGLNKLQSIR